MLLTDVSAAISPLIGATEHIYFRILSCIGSFVVNCIFIMKKRELFAAELCRYGAKEAQCFRSNMLCLH